MTRSFCFAITAANGETLATGRHEPSCSSLWLRSCRSRHCSRLPPSDATRIPPASRPRRPVRSPGLGSSVAKPASHRRAAHPPDGASDGRGYRHYPGWLPWCWPPTPSWRRSHVHEGWPARRYHLRKRARMVTPDIAVSVDILFSKVRQPARRSLGLWVGHRSTTSGGERPSSVRRTTSSIDLDGEEQAQNRCHTFKSLSRDCAHHLLQSLCRDDA